MNNSKSRMVDIMAYAINCHASTNHLYDGNPYVIHLAMVVNTAIRHIDLIPDVDTHQEDVIAACWLHDVIEDCRQSYNDVKDVAGFNVAEIVYAVTNEKGKNRSERANDAYYDGIRKTTWACFVKMCDRIANAQYSKDKESNMLLKYREENTSFLSRLQLRGVYKPLVIELDKILYY